VYLVKLHQFPTIHFLGLIERDELDALRGWSFIRERPLAFRQIMGANRNKSPIPSEIVVNFVLKSNERFIPPLCELDAPQNRCCNIWTHFLSLRGSAK
jgi:hypothetical protein